MLAALAAVDDERVRCRATGDLHAAAALLEVAGKAAADLAALRRDLERDVHDMMPGYSHEVPGVGYLSRATTAGSKRTDSVALLGDVLAAAAHDPETGEVVPAVALARIKQALLLTLPITESLAWRVGGLDRVLGSSSWKRERVERIPGRPTVNVL